ncbi:glycosyltransferase [Azospirillum sp. sgz302134]
MRILQTILSKGFRGAERHVAELVNAQARHHDVLLLLRKDCSDGNGVSIRDWLDPAVRVQTLSRPLWTWQAWRAIRRFRPDIVHAHGGRASRLAPRVAGKAPVVATIHLDYRHSYYKAVDGLICTTDWQRDGISADYKGRTARIDLWYTPRPRLDSAAVLRERRALVGDENAFVIGFVGHLIPSKGCDLLIEAFRRAKLPDARLVIVGDGPEREALERAAPLDVVFTGFRPDARDLFQAFDLFVSPSRDEPFGLVFLEALDAGAPILATRSQGALALLPGFPAELVNLDDVEAMTAALRRAHAHRKPRYVADLRRFDREGRLSEIDAFYAELIRGKS